MIWATLQWILISLLVIILLWAGYYVAYPAASRTVEDHPKPLIRAGVHFVQVLTILVLGIAWWSAILSFVYMPEDIVINLIPTIIIALVTIPAIARFLRAVTPYKIMLYLAFVVPLIITLVVIDTMGQLLLIAVPFAVFFPTTIILELLRARSPSTKRLLDHVLVAEPGLYLKVTDTRLYLILGLMTAIELAFQVSGFSLIYPGIGL